MGRKQTGNNYPIQKKKTKYQKEASLLNKVTMKIK